jgi:hypothetical protein
MKTSLYKRSNNSIYYYSLLTNGKKSLIECIGKLDSKENFRIKEYTEIENLDTFYYSKVRENLSE